ncbi:MAG: class I SAM-dependent methyltransferase, partial [bacterium]
SNLQKEAALAIIKNVHFRGNEEILDVGCGDGKITAHIAHKVPKGHVFGIDQSPNMIQSAQNDFASVKNLSFQIADAANFSFEQKFDYVFSFSTLHWVKDLLNVLKSIKAVLERNGKVFIRMGTNEDSVINRTFRYLCSSEQWKPYFPLGQKSMVYYGKSASEVEQLFAQAGFIRTRVELNIKKRIYKSGDDLVAWLMGWIPHSSGLPKGKDLEFAQATVQHIYEHHHKKLTEPIEIACPNLQVEAL